MIIFLYGEDTFRSRQKLNELKEKFVREVDQVGGGLSMIDGVAATMADVHNAVAAHSLFARKKMIVVENIFTNKNKKICDELAEYFQKRKDEQEGNIIIFWDENSGDKLGKNKLFIFLSKQKFVQNFAPLSNTATTAWIRAEVERRGAKIKPQAATLLGGFFQNDLWQLNTEIDKLVNYKIGVAKKSTEEAVVEVADIEEMCRGNSDENIFALTDAIGAKNKALMLSLLEKELEHGVGDGYLLHMIIRQIKNLVLIKDALEQGLTIRKIESSFGMHPYVVKKTIAQAAGFNIKGLKNIFNKLLEIDASVKLGKGDLKSELSLLLVRI